MTLTTTHLEHARRVADAILYEGYLLYPYHQAAQKNQIRFQFGVLMPPEFAAVDPSEHASCQTECLLECRDDAEVLVQVRFLQLQRRVVQSVAADTGRLADVASLAVDGVEYTCWDEAVEREHEVRARVSALLDSDAEIRFDVAGGETTEDLTDSAGLTQGLLVRRREPLAGTVSMQAERVAGPYQALRLRVALANTTAQCTEPDDVPHSRSAALPYALIAAHSLIGVPGGRFLSMTDPPEWAAAEVARCANIRTWPVLAGPSECTELVLSSPVILYDHPEIAAESAGDLFDATEIDEILTLRTLALTDNEKQQARSTDARAAELIDRLDHLPPEMLDRMHGAIRYLGSPAPGGAAAQPAQPWWDPGSDASVSPETDHIVISGVRVARGSRVRMQPGSRRADAQDLFLAGREAIVEAVLFDVDDQVHLAVTPVDDPAADLQRNHGRFLYFAPDEVVPEPGERAN